MFNNLTCKQIRTETKGEGLLLTDGICDITDIVAVRSNHHNVQRDPKRCVDYTEYLTKGRSRAHVPVTCEKVCLERWERVKAG